jgi:hypothetical protein
MTGIQETMTVTVTYNWYEYRQNNSGGSFTSNDDVAHYVLVQATSPKEANDKAESFGVYFDGCHNGYDCTCCGDRWYEVRDPLTEFKVWGFRASKECDTVVDYAEALTYDDSFAKEGTSVVVVYFADGTKQVFKKKGKK